MVGNRNHTIRKDFGEAMTSCVVLNLPIDGGNMVAFLIYEVGVALKWSARPSLGGDVYPDDWHLSDDAGTEYLFVGGYSAKVDEDLDAGETRFVPRPPHGRRSFFVGRDGGTALEIEVSIDRIAE